MYRVQLSDRERQELQQRTHAPGVRPRTRDRLEMVRLCDAGWHVPRIARHLGMNEKSVRRWITAFREQGFDAFRDRPPVGRTACLTPAIREAVRQEFAKGDRTWTAAQVAVWLTEQYRVSVRVSHLRRLLRCWKLSDKRTRRSVKHKQRPEEVAIKKPELEAMEKGEQGLIDLYHSDEAPATAALIADWPILASPNKRAPRSEGSSTGIPLSTSCRK